MVYTVEVLTNIKKVSTLLYPLAISPVHVPCLPFHQLHIVAQIDKKSV